jgi:DNA-binding NtrC family response regulator
VRAGRFREDLYFRLAVLELRVPPLRERPDDLAPLARHMLRRITRGKTVEVEPAAIERLRAHPFPGNVRELRNVLERALLLGDGATIRAADLPAEIGAGTAPGSESFPTLAELERGHVEVALRRTRGNRSAAARLLGIDRKTLWAKLKALGIRAGLDEPEPGEGA